MEENPYKSPCETDDDPARREAVRKVIVGLFFSTAAGAFGAAMWICEAAYVFQR